MLYNEAIFFENNRAELCELYANKYIAIKNGAVIDVGDDFYGTFEKAREGEKAGTFLVRLCVSLEDETILLNSAVPSPSKPR